MKKHKTRRKNIRNAILVVVLGALIAFASVVASTVISYVEFSKDLIHNELVLIKSLLNQAYRPEDGIDKALMTATSQLFENIPQDAYSEMIYSRVAQAGEPQILYRTKAVRRERQYGLTRTSEMDAAQGAQFVHIQFNWDSPGDILHIDLSPGGQVLFSATAFRNKLSNLVIIDTNETFDFEGQRFMMTNRINLSTAISHYANISSMLILVAIALIACAMYFTMSPLARTIRDDQLRLSQILDRSGVLMRILSRRDGALLFTNQPLDQVLGRRRLFTYEQIWNLPRPLDSSKSQPVYDAMHRRWYQSTLFDLNWRGNEPATLEIYIDITQLQQVGLQNERLAAINLAQKDFVSVLDEDLNLVYLNPSGYRMCGYKEGENITPLMLHDDESIELLRGDVLARINADPLYQWTGETKLKRKDGTLLDVEQTVLRISGEHGEPLGYATILRDITDAKRMQREVRVQSTVARFTTDFVAVTDPELQVIYANDGAYEMAGIDRAGQGALTLDTVFDVQTAKAVRAGLRTAMRTGSWGMDLALTRADGTALDVALKSFCIRDEAERPTGIGIIMRDITQLKQLQRDMQTQSAIAEWSTNFIMVLDVDLTPIYLNESAYRITGYSQRDPEAKDKLARALLQDPKHPGQLLPGAKQALTTGHFSGETTFKRPDGRELQLSQNLYTILDERGKNSALVLMMNDVSGIKHAQDELQKAKSRLEIALHVSNACVWEIDMERGKVFLDENAPPIMGIPGRGNQEYSLQEFYALMLEMAGPEVMGRWFGSFERGWVDDSNIPPELKLTWRDGSVHYVANFGHSTVGPSGLPTSTIGLSMDITGTIELQQQLLRAKEQAEAASQAKSQFLSSISHEIRTPMNAILGMTRIARASSDLKKIYGSLDKVETSSIHLLSILNDVLDLAKIESGRFELSGESFSLETALSNIASVVAVRAEEKRISLIVKLDPNIPRALYGDDMRLSQVIMNLMGNAIKFTPEQGAIWLEAQLLPSLDARVHLHFLVRDTGIGMNEEQLSRMFQMFEQADNSITKKYGGTGLGLAISKRIVEMMDGEISVTSTPGAGSTFSFDVYMEPAKGDVPTPILAPAAAALSVLVIESRAEVAHSLADALRSLGSPCLGASTLDEAEALLAKGRPIDAVFLDASLPVEQAARLKSLTGDAKFVLMTNLFVQGDAGELGQLLGTRELITKPVLQGALITQLNHMVGVEPEIPASAFAAGDVRYDGKRLLMAEDIEVNSEILIALLEPTGIGIDCVSDGAQALERMRRDPDRYDLIFMDVQMPGMDGYEATRRIRALKSPRAKSIPILAMTANAFNEDIELALQSGMNGHLSKPIDEKRVLEALATYLSESQQLEQRQQREEPSPDGPNTTIVEDSTMSDPYFGVNAAAGLRMLGGNTKIYARLLNTYASGNLYDNFVDAMKEGDVEKVQVAAHTLKGATGNLHLEELFETIKAIEGRVKETHALPGEAEVTELADIQLRTMASIKAILENPELLEQFK